MRRTTKSFFEGFLQAMGLGLFMPPPRQSKLRDQWKMKLDEETREALERDARVVARDLQRSLKELEQDLLTTAQDLQSTSQAKSLSRAVTRSRLFDKRRLGS